MSARPRTEEIVVDADGLVAAVRQQLAAGHRAALVAAHEDPDSFRVVYVLVRTQDDHRVEVVLRTPKENATVPSLAAEDYTIGRFEREVRDLYGITPVAHPLPRRLVRHGHWPRGWYPMRSDADPHPEFEPDTGSYPFVSVEGNGVYEIPVGPVHAGLIEPGHFRFSVVGETILRMKARLWFVYRGVEKLLEGRTPEAAIELTERISGDTAVGHSLAFAMAVEEALGIEVAEEDQVVRALLLELERIHNHVADLGALANDVGFSVVNSHALRIREHLLRLNQQTNGHRLLRGGIRIGGAHLNALPDRKVIDHAAHDAAELVEITLGNSTVRDRFTGTAVLDGASARQLGTLGFVARASGIDIDARRDHPFVELGDSFSVVVEDDGDVMSRYLVRARELAISARLVAELSDRLGTSRGSGSTTAAVRGGAGLGLVEGWRGTIAHRVDLDQGGRLTRVKVVDPSFLNWPALPVALADTIVPDFPLANKSFNQSYAGNDL